MKIRHLKSGTEFEKKKNGNFQITKKGDGQCWIASRPVGFSLAINDVEHKISMFWIEAVK